MATTDPGFGLYPGTRTPGSAISGASRALRRLRLATQCTQTAFADHLGISAETYRVWESGRRIPPRAIVDRARRLKETDCGRLLPLQQLAMEYHVHVRTLRKAAHDGRLDAVFSTRAAFGHAVAFASRQAVESFKRHA